MNDRPCLVLRNKLTNNCSQICTGLSLRVPRTRGDGKGGKGKGKGKGGPAAEAPADPATAPEGVTPDAAEGAGNQAPPPAVQIPGIGGGPTGKGGKGGKAGKGGPPAPPTGAPGGKGAPLDGKIS